MTIDTSTSRTKILDRLSAIQSQQGQLIDKALLDESRPKALYAKTALELEEHFTRILEAHSGKVFSLDNMDNLPKAVASHLENLSLTPVVYAGSNSRLDALDWNTAGIQWKQESFSDDGLVSIAEADCAIADTGTLVLTSSANNPTRNNFLAEHHLLVLQRQSMKVYSEDAWEFLHQTYSSFPRAINFISGPSSSADVGLKLEYGAHGPRTLAVFIY